MDKNAKLHTMYLNFANILTAVRIFLVPVFIYTFLKSPNTYLSVILFCLCVVTDMLDGLAARIFKLKTLLGTYLDPIADKILILSSYYVLTNLGRIPMWLFIIILGKDIIIVSGWLLIYILGRIYKIYVGFLGRLNLCVQILTILVVLLNMEPAFSILFHITAVTTIVTTAEYCINGAKEITNIYEGRK